jgi:hypothetical protein
VRRPFFILHPSSFILSKEEISMRRFILGLLGLLLLVGVLVHSLSRAADAPLAGTWKVTVLATAGEDVTHTPLWIVRLDKDGKTVEKVAAIPDLTRSTAGKLTIDARGVHFTMSVQGTDFRIAAYLPEGKDRADTLLGSMEFRGRLTPAQLTRTTETTLDAKSKPQPVEGNDQLKKAVDETDGPRQETALAAVVKNFAGKPVAVPASQILVGTRVANKASKEILEATADGYAREAARYGPELEQSALIIITRTFAGHEKTADLALKYIRRAEKLLTEGDPPERQVAVLKLLISTLEKNGLKDEVKVSAPRLEKLEQQLDAEFVKRSMPFKVEPFKGRKGTSDRTVVVELFTGAQCPPCVAADVAFDAVRESYPPKDVVLVQYHLHIPGPDPLTNSDSETRQQYYGDEKVEGTPTTFIDGGLTKDFLGGPQDLAEANYGKLRKMVNEALETKAGARLELAAQRKGDTIDIQAQVSGVDSPGPKVRLRLLLLEEVVRFPGSNGQRLHHHVVRAMPGGPAGIAVEKKTLTHKETVDVGALRKKLSDYLTEYAKKETGLSEERPLELAKLKVVALIQDDSNQKILQAAQVSVGE